MTEAEKIQAYLTGRVPSPVTNFRGWDYERIMDHGEFNLFDHVLDTGAMHTYFCVYLAQHVQSIVATDSFAWADRDYMKEQNLLTPDQWMKAVRQCEVFAEKADVCHLPYSDGTFDKVLSISTIEHIRDDTQAMSEMFRVLKTGGLLLLTTELGLVGKLYSERDGSYYRIYDIAHLMTLLRRIPDTDMEILTSAPYIYTEDTVGISYVTVFAKIRKLR